MAPLMFLLFKPSFDVPFSPYCVSLLLNSSAFQIFIFVLLSMASSSESRSRGNGKPHVLCFHQDLAPLRRVKVQGPTRGKCFYGCSHWHNSCGFFKWADEEDRVQELQFLLFERDTRIAELEILIKELENEVKNLKETNWKLEDDVAEMAIENTEQLAIISSATVDKKLYNLLVASWVLFAIVLLLLERGG
ncbi:DNA topoisomerase 3-alpha [Bienertia sinuspersici]